MSKINKSEGITQVFIITWDEVPSYKRTLQYVLPIFCRL